MPVVGDHDTLTMDGQLHGRDFIEGTTEEDHKKIYYFVVWPNLLISLHPDYLMTHRVVPARAGPHVHRLRVVLRTGDAWPNPTSTPATRSTSGT